MSLLSNIVGAFNPRGPAVAPPPMPVALPATPPVASTGAGSGPAQTQQDPPIPGNAAQGTAGDVVFEPQPQPAAVARPVYSVPPIAGPVSGEAPAGAVREIGVHQFDAVRLQPAGSAVAAMASAASPMPEPALVQDQAAVAEPPMQAASIYTRAVYLLMADRGPTTQQRIMQAL